MNPESKEMRSEYDPALLREGVRGKYAKRYAEEGSNVVLIDPDLHEKFPTSEAVNQALREYVSNAESNAR